MPSARILVLGGPDDYVAELSAVFSFLDYEPEWWRDDLEALNVDECLALVVLDMESTEFSNLKSMLSQARFPVPVLHGDVEKAGELSNVVLFELPRPLRNVQLGAALREISLLRIAQQVEPQSSGPTGNSSQIRQVRKLIGQVAGFETTVLIRGESGTGKEVAARAIHRQSKRAERDFVVVNCATVSAEQLNQWWGQLMPKHGVAQHSDPSIGGTLLLDEIGDMEISVQGHLLRLLQSQNGHAPFRVIASTHEDLETSVARAEFREDLYYQLNVFPIDMPALRERVEDLPLLIDEISRQLDGRGSNCGGFCAEAIHALRAHDWPGNIRELANLVERLAVLYPAQIIEVNMLPQRYQHTAVTQWGLESVEPASTLPSEGLDLKNHMADIELQIIRQALEQSHGVVSQAAQLLKLRRTTLVEKLKKYQRLASQS